MSLFKCNQLREINIFSALTLKRVLWLQKISVKTMLLVYTALKFMMNFALPMTLTLWRYINFLWNYFFTTSEWIHRNYCRLIRWAKLWSDKSKTLHGPSARWCTSTHITRGLENKVPTLRNRHCDGSWY